MNGGVIEIGWLDIAVTSLPMVLVVAVLFRWSVGGWTAIHATARMVIQLVAIGYLLIFIFEASELWIICAVLAVMLLVASWICLRPIAASRARLYPQALISLAVGGGFTLFTVSVGVLHLEPWYAPRYLVPLAGMIFANAMNTVSVAAERFESELDGGEAMPAARSVALQTGMIPVFNSMFAVGLVALPGMMTGQILSGVSPLIAVRYQIVVMCMLFAASGLSAALYLELAGRRPR